MSIMVVQLPSSSVIRPQEIPATGALIGTPAAMSARVEPQTDACEVEPFDERTSDTHLIAYGNSSIVGRTGTSERSASAPCPISRRPGERTGFASPVE